MTSIGSGSRTLVTGGASFIGSHLVDALVERGAKVRVVLGAYYSETGMKSASCRYFTVYAERGHENHAVK
jgi:nucleoside-diphosphate-sugar epimerase